MGDRRGAPELGIEPLTARSLALTALLGTHPPRLPARALVALGALFGFAEGAMRTALSRMAASGEIEADGGSYGLGERMRRRQADQDVGRSPAPADWDGTWWIAIVDAGGRTVGERRAFRSRMQHARMGELRPDVWLRPANLPGPAPAADLLVSRGTIAERDPVALAGRLWDLEALAASARSLTAAAEEATRSLAAGDPRELPGAFLASVAVIRLLRDEPMLPPDLVGPDWPADALRRAYDSLEDSQLRLLSSFVAALG